MPEKKRLSIRFRKKKEMRDKNERFCTERRLIKNSTRSVFYRGVEQTYGFCGDYDVVFRTDAGVFQKTLTLSKFEPGTQEIQLKNKEI